MVKKHLLFRKYDKGCYREVMFQILSTLKKCGENKIPEIIKLFGFGGKKGQKSMISFHDAYAVPETVVTNIRYNIAINKLTQSAKNTTLNDLEVVEQGIFKAGFRLINFDDELEWILNALKEVDTGLIRFGGRRSCGFGKMRIGDFCLKISEGYNADLSIKNEQEFTSFESALKYVEGSENLKNYAPNYDFVSFGQSQIYIGDYSGKKPKKNIKGHIDITIICLDNVYIGSGFFSSRNKSICNEPIKFRNDCIIPGSSFKGALRNIASAVSEACLPKFKKKEDKKPNNNECNDKQRCIVCDMFGTVNYASRLIIPDFKAEKQILKF